jgi:hypothetical protein
MEMCVYRSRSLPQPGNGAGCVIATYKRAQRVKSEDTEVGVPILSRLEIVLRVTPCGVIAVMAVIEAVVLADRRSNARL